MFDASSRGAVNYLNLAREVLQKNNLTQMSQEEKIIDLAKDVAFSKDEKINVSNG